MLNQKPVPKFRFCWHFPQNSDARRQLRDPPDRALRPERAQLPRLPRPGSRRCGKLPRSVIMILKILKLFKDNHNRDLKHLDSLNDVMEKASPLPTGGNGGSNVLASLLGTVAAVILAKLV